MRIFSNFDTGLSQRLCAAEAKEHGEENVLFIKRDKIYLFFRVYLPILWWLVLSALLMWWAYSTGISWLQTTWWIIVIVSWLFFLTKVIIKLIDYNMDFMIVTPYQITSYDQWFIFDRSVDALDISKIKSINIDKKWLWCSIFNYGSIVFFSEWDVAESSDNNRLWSIRMNYIDHPRQVKRKITTIISIWGAFGKQHIEQESTSQSSPKQKSPSVSDVTNTSSESAALEAKRIRMAHYQQSKIEEEK